jgi:enediyne polyketide synthase
MDGAVPVFARELERERLEPLRRRVVSTVTGAALPPDEDLRALLTRQITDPVRFAEAAAVVAAEAEVLIEVGPGKILSGLVDAPAVPMKAGEGSALGLLEAAAAAHAAGARLKALPETRRGAPQDASPRLEVRPGQVAAPAG